MSRKGTVLARQLSHKPDQFQQQAIDSTAQGIRIVAPAGSGKSETLARRVAKRIQKDGVDPRRILVLTFDNAAKKSLSSFFDDVLDARHKPQIRTFNSHGDSILKTYFPDEHASIAANPIPAEVKQLRQRTDSQSHEYPVLTWDGVARKLTDVIAALKEQGFSPDDGNRDKATNWLRDEYLMVPREGESASIDDYWGMPAATPADDTYAGQIRGILDVFSAYDTEIRQTGYMEYIDQKSRPVHALRQSRKACDVLQGQFDEIVVDECQDISRLDAMLVYYTAGKDTRVVLAGDDDQTLYEWRNAQSLYLRHPEIVFQHLTFETVHLNLNYRSPQEILGPAVKLIGHNVERIEKSPSSAVTKPGELQVLPSGSTFEQMQVLAQEIQREIAAGRAPAEIAVLLHTNHDERTIREALGRYRIPMQSQGRSPMATTDGVELVSFLKAKGREWPVVCIPNVIDRDVPDADSVRKGEVESVRRRFYVAMTRASEKLLLTYVRGGDDDRIYRTAEGDVVGTNGASRFLFEAGLVDTATDAAAEPAVVPEPASSPISTLPAPQTTPSAEPEVPAPVAAAPMPAAPVEPPAATPVAQEKPRKRGKLQDWEPRADDTRNMIKARSEWQAGDFDTAIFCAWKPLELVLKRVVKLPPGTRKLDSVTMIDEAVVQGLIDMAWKDRLHLWRRVRNQAQHEDINGGTFSPEKFRDYGFQMVDGAPEFFAHLADRMAPKQLVLETQDDFVRRLSNLVTQIQQGKPSPISGKPLRALRFHPEQNQFDVLAMQLLMVLRDVRFYVPEEFRWSSSPLISYFTVEALGHTPSGFRTATANRLRLDAGEQRTQLMSRFNRIVDQECGEDNPGRFLLERLNDGLALENGNFHAGLKLNPRGRV